MPLKDPIKRKEYHDNYYLGYKEKQLQKIKEDRKLYPWKYTLKSIKNRCNNPNNPYFRWYGAIGIKCLITIEELKELWFRDKAYLLKEPTIDRKNSKDHYTFDNCRYIEKAVNSSLAYRHEVFQYDISGKFIKKWDCVADAARYFKVNEASIRGAVKRGGKCKGFLWEYKDIK